MAVAREPSSLIQPSNDCGFIRVRERDRFKTAP